MTVLPGSSYFSSDESFAMIRGYVQPSCENLILEQDNVRLPTRAKNFCLDLAPIDRHYCIDIPPDNNSNSSQLFTEVEVNSGTTFTDTEVNNCFSIYHTS